MALDLFKKAETRRGLLAAEKAALLYNGLTSVLIVLLFSRMDHPVRMLADRALIAGMTLLLVYLYRLAPCKFSAFVRVAVQLSLLSYWYPDTFEFNRLFPNLDHVFASAEQWIFGGQPAVWFSQRFPQIWVSEPLNMGYVFYYPMILIVTVWYFVRRFDLFDKFAFIVVASFFLYYVVYIFLPVAGPQFYFPAIGDELVEQGVFPSLHDYFHHNQELLPTPGYEHGFFFNLVESSQRVGERPTAAFPSSHVGVSTILMVLSWKAGRRLFAGLLPFYVLLCCATVYIQAHYVIDAIAGFCSAFPVYALAAWAFDRWFAQGRPKAASSCGRSRMAHSRR